jgi:FecR-like protein
MSCQFSVISSKFRRRDGAEARAKGTDLKVGHYKNEETVGRWEQAFVVGGSPQKAAATKIVKLADAEAWCNELRDGYVTYMQRVNGSFWRLLMRFTQPLVSLLLFSALNLGSAIPTNGAVIDKPQIVRVSYVQGDVKFSPGTKGSPDLGKDWTEAGVNLPIAEGATLATEEGRAQVEFENGSVAYLAEHSVLQFKGLKSNAQRTSTTMALLTGTASFAHESNGQDELTIETLAADLHTRSALILRVESALDGAVFRVVEGTLEIVVGAAGQTVQMEPGQAVQCVGGVVSRVEEPESDVELKAWDQWVSEERAARKADIEKGLKESGLTAPIPGLVDLVREGTFTDCAPYGKCWEPNVEAEAGQSEAKAVPATQAQSPGAEGAGATNSGTSQSAKVRYVKVREPAGTFAFADGPCSTAYADYYVEKTLLITPQNPKGRVVKEEWTISGTSYYSDSWTWATCHAGSWVPDWRRLPCKQGEPNRHAKCQPPKKKWVVGPKSRSGSFVKVKIGKKIGYIPKHPLDVKGKPPLNAKDGVLVFQQKKGQEVATVKAEPKKLEIVRNVPAGYETNWTKNMPKVEKPVITGKVLKNGTEPWSVVSPKTGSQKVQTAIRYDYKTKNFVAATNGAASERGKEQPVVIAHVGASYGGGNSPRSSNQNLGNSYAGSAGKNSGNNGGGGSSRGASQSASRGSSGGGGGASRGSSSGGGSSSHTSSYSGGGGGGGASHASSGGGGGGPSSPAPAPSPGRPH